MNLRRYNRTHTDTEKERLEVIRKKKTFYR